MHCKQSLGLNIAGITRQAEMVGCWIRQKMYYASIYLQVVFKPEYGPDIQHICGLCGYGQYSIIIHEMFSSKTKKVFRLKFM